MQAFVYTCIHSFDYLNQVSVTDADANRPKEFVYFLTGQAKEIGPNGRETFEINSDTGEIFLNVVSVIMTITPDFPLFSLRR